MALPRGGIPHSPGSVDERGAVLIAAERQLQHAEAAVNFIDGIAGGRWTHTSKISASSSGDDLFNALHGIEDSRWRLRVKSLVVVLVSIEDEIHPSVIQYAPDRLHRR